jgi:hypothetical protein
MHATRMRRKCRPDRLSCTSAGVRAREWFSRTAIETNTIWSGELLEKSWRSPARKAGESYQALEITGAPKGRRRAVRKTPIKQAQISFAASALLPRSATTSNPNNRLIRPLWGGQDHPKRDCCAGLNSVVVWGLPLKSCCCLALD